MKHLILLILLVLIIGCKNNLPELDSIKGEDYILLDQDSTVVHYPENFRGEILVVGYIFTNCPDICPLTTNNMILIQQKLTEEGINGVRFAAISFDPDFDTPFVLKNYMKVRNIDYKNWTFLTGEKSEINRLMKRMEIFSAVSDSSTLKSGKKMYFYVHTDRISLFDRNLNLRKNYPGSTLNIEEIINDIKNIR
jgi:protein SCO1/2